MGNQVHSPHLRVPRRPAIQDGQMPRRDIALTPQLIMHPLRHTLLAPATDASHVQLGKSVCPILRTARPAVCPSMTRAVPRARVINTQRRTVEPAELARLRTREQPWPISRLDNTCPRRQASLSRRDAPTSRRKQPERTRLRSCHPPRSAETRPSELSRPAEAPEVNRHRARGPTDLETLLIPHGVSEKADPMTGPADRRRRKQPVSRNAGLGCAAPRVGDHGGSCVARPAHRR